MSSNIAKSQLLYTQQKRSLRYAVADVMCFLLIGWEHEEAYAEKISCNAERSFNFKALWYGNWTLLLPFESFWCNLSRTWQHLQTELVFESRSRSRIQWDQLFPVDTCCQTKTKVLLLLLSQINCCNWPKLAPAKSPQGTCGKSVQFQPGRIWQFVARGSLYVSMSFLWENSLWETQLWQIVSKG